MLDPSGKSEKRTKRGLARTPLHESAAVAAWVFGGLILLFLMLIVFVDVNPAKFPIIRFMMALSAGFFAYFFGRVVLEGTLKGFAISAAGGAALFILIQFVFDPFQVLPTRSSSTPPAGSANVSQPPSPTPSVKSASPSGSPRSVTTTTQIATPTTEVKKFPPIDVRKTLNEAEGLIQSGNPRDKEKALQLYRQTVAAIKRADLPQALLQEAESAYTNHNDDAARDKYKAVLHVYLRNNERGIQP